MRYLDIDQIGDSAFLARPLCNDNGVALIKEGVQITSSLLDRLRGQNYVGLYIEDELSKGILIEEVVDESLRLQASDTLKNIYKKKMDYERIYPIINTMIDQVSENYQRLIQVNLLQNYNEYLYAHSVNVAILSIRIGLEFGLTSEQLQGLAIAAIFHDAGKTQISESILNKVGRLTDSEFEEMKSHVNLSYEITRNWPRITSVSRAAILQHHERNDGSGYPRNLKGDDIILFGKIIGVTDTYDAMTTDRVYRGAHSVSDVVEFLMANANILFDFDLIQAFTRCIAVYPTGSIVQLSNGKSAIIVRNYRDCILRPVVRLTDTLEEIDLKDDSRYLDLSIVKVV